MLLREPKPVEEKPLELIDLPLPEPGPGEIRLAVRVCGACHADLLEEANEALLALKRSEIDGVGVLVVEQRPDSS